MWWLPLATGVMSYLNNANKEKQLQNYNKAQAEITRYSPWTGMTGHIQQNTGPSNLGAAFGGAVQGLGIAQSINNAGGMKKLFGVGGSTPAQTPISQPVVGQSAVAAQNPYSLGINYSFNQPTSNPYSLAMK